LSNFVIFGYINISIDTDTDVWCKSYWYISITFLSWSRGGYCCWV